MNLLNLLFSFCLLISIASGAHAEALINDGTVNLGMSLPLSGPQAINGLALKGGVESYLHYFNQNGGISGRKIQLVALDDAGDVARTVENTKKLLEEFRVLALLGYHGTAAAEAVLPLLPVAGAPLIGPTSGAESLHEPFNRHVFNLFASYKEETETILNQLDFQTLIEVAVLYQKDRFGQTGLKEAEAVMLKLSLRKNSVGAVAVNSGDVTQAVKTIADGKPQAVLLICPAHPAAEFIKQIHKAGLFPQFIAASYMDVGALFKELGPEARGVAISQVVPIPWSSDLTLLRQYQAIAKQQLISVYGLQGFMAAKLTVEAMQKIGRNLSREKLISALETDYDLGGYRLRFKRDNHSGSKYTEMTVITRDGKLSR
ncbi:ABC transporter substrate-binding protein [Undibacterium sp. RuTC16W]|uniref:ABC transporter substrate-binding protein n=1 Tax=Undibacterium sp. RuTC16W TaxID=3413048 RepID=UPI003BF2D5EE